MSIFKGKLETAKLWFRKQWGWVVTTAAFFVFFGVFGLLYSYGIIFVALKDDLGSSASPTSWVGSIAIGFHTLGALVSNPLVARFGARLVAALGLIMCVTSLVLTSFMPTITPMFFTFSILYGFGVNMVLISSISLILQYFPTKNCSRATSMSLVGTTAGMLAMNLLVYFLVTQFGWRNMFRIMAGLILAMGIPAISTYSQPPSNPDHVRNDLEEEKQKAVAPSAPRSRWARKPSLAGLAHTHKTKKLAKAAEQLAIPEEVFESESDQTMEKMMPPTTTTTIITEVRIEDGKEVKVQIPGKPVSRTETLKKRLQVLLFPELWFLAFGLMGCAMTMSFYYVSMVNFMTTAGIAESKCALVMAVVAIAEVIGKLMLGIVGDHLPFPKIFLFVIAALLGIGIMFSLFVAKTVAAMMCIAVVTGFFIMTVFDALPYSICNQVFGAARSVEACTVILVANGLGLILGSLFGESVDKTGSYDDAIYASIGIYCAASVLFSLVPLYQRCFAPDRYIMARTKPKFEDEFAAMGPFESWIFLPPAIESTVHLDYESSV